MWANQQIKTVVAFLVFAASLCAQNNDYGSMTITELRAKAEQGDAAAQCGLGLIYCNGEGAPKDFTEALKWLRKASDQGDAKAE